MKETELAQDVVNFLNDYDLYYEVWDVDIIAKMGNILTAVEVKTILNFKVIEQAFKNRNLFNYSYIAVPYAKYRNFQYKICEDYGIGVLQLTYSRYNGRLLDVEEIVKPKLNRKAYAIKTIKLTLEDKKSIPGASGRDGTTRTAFKITIENMVSYIKRHPECTLKKCLEDIDFHWANMASAKGCVYARINEGIIKEFRLENGKLYLTQ